MSCCIENEGAKLKVTLTFGREQLLYDIKNNAYVESHVMAPETEHAKHMVADVGERLIVSCSEKRAKKDAYNRARGIARLRKAYKSGHVTK